MTILGVEFKWKVCLAACFCLWSLNTLFKGTWYVKGMKVTQTHPMENTWGQARLASMAVLLSLTLAKQTLVSQSSVFIPVILGKGGLWKIKMTLVKIFFLCS